MQNQTNQPSSQSSTRARGQEATNKLAEKAEQATTQVKNAAIDRVHSVREQAQTGIDEGRERVVNRIRGVSSALRSVSDSLRSDDPTLAEYATTASSRIEGIASYVSSADPRSLLRDAGNFARERPAWFFGGAFLLGLAAGRFLKSSADDDDALELGDSDIEELPRYDYRRDAYRREQRYAGSSSGRPYESPITPAATIPVTQGTSGSATPGTSSFGGSSSSTETSSGSSSTSSANPVTSSTVPGSRTT